MKCVMVPMYSVLISLCLVSCVICTEPPAVVEHQFDDYRSCDRGGEDLTELSYLGWPYMFECKTLVANFGFMIEEEGKYDDESGECIIRDLYTGNTLWNKTMHVDSWYYVNYIEKDYRYYTPDIDELSPASYIILFKHAGAEFCSYQIVHLNITELSEQPECENFNEDFTDFLAHNRVGDEVGLSCEVPDRVKPALYLDWANPDDITYEWTYNCSDKFERNVFFVNDSMMIHRSNFRNAGVYTCSVIYKGQKRYAIQYRFCLKYDYSSITQFSLNCPDELEVHLHEDALIDCQLDLGTGKTNEFDIYAAWEKVLPNGTVVKDCKNDIPSVRNSTSDPRIQCNLTSSIEDKCYMYVPEEGISSDIVTVSLRIRNVEYSDFGVYYLRSGVIGNLQHRNITLLKTNENILRQNVFAIIAGTCGIVVLCLFLAILVWRKYDVLWYYKKYFGPYETEFRNYTAYLAYYYSTDENDISSESQRLTKKLVLKLSDLLTKFGGNTYNEQKDADTLQYKADNIYEMQKDCHRVIIVLTPEYIKDHWSICKAYMALHSMVENGTKIIFIVTPGARKVLNSVSEQSKTTLLKAMKMNTTIHWSGKIPLGGTFRRRLEYSLPKLPPPGYNRCLSNASQAPLTQFSREFGDLSPKHEKTFSCAV